MDEITLEKLEIFANHGVYDFEKENGQVFYIDVTYLVDEPKNDDISCTVDYGKVAEEIYDFTTKRNYDIIEKLASDLATNLLTKFNMQSVTLTVNKPNAPIKLKFENVKTTVKKAWTRAYVAFGSNLGDRKQYIENAISTTKNCPEIRLRKVSSIIETEPFGVTDQPNFLNGVMELDTIFSKNELLGFCKKLELDAGRIKTRKWGERTFDADIIFYGDEVYYSDDLIIPHPEMHLRRFVLEPLSELCPNYIHPVKKESVKELLQKLN